MPDVRSTTGRLQRPDGAAIDFAVTGAGPPILFAHGLGGSLESWCEQTRHFGRQHTVVTFSHRGFASSTVPGGLPDPKDYAGDALALLDHLGVERAVIVGQSMGGWTAVELALAAPDRVAGLVLACTTGSLSFDTFEDAELARWRATSPAAQADLTERGIHPACGARMAMADPGRHRRYVQIDGSSAGLDKAALRRRLQDRRRRGLADAARIACPVLCITGADDCVMPPRGVALMARHMPSARVVEVPASGHSVYFERPAVFNALVGAFLQEIGWRPDSAGVLHELWVEPDGLTGVGLVGPEGDGFRALLAPGSRLVTTFEACSHRDAMDVYYQLDGRDGSYTTSFPSDDEPYSASSTFGTAGRDVHPDSNDTTQRE